MKRVEIEQKKTVIIPTTNPAAVSCDCVLCKIRSAMAEAMMVKLDEEIMRNYHGKTEGEEEK